MRIVIPGGTGQIGRVLVPALVRRGHDVTVLTRRGAADPGCRTVLWDGGSAGSWTACVDGADAVINLAGRSVDCRYTKHNLTAMLASRVDATRAVGRAIAESANPPPVWLNASTATIYEHTFDRDNDEAGGRIGGREPGVPAYWRFSIEIAEAWERELEAADAPRTRRVALRMAMMMAPTPGGTFDVLRRMVRFGLGGAIAGGRQYFSWIHERDLVRAVEWILEHDGLHGPINLAAPDPRPQADFMRELRRAAGAPFGLPATARMAELGACVLGTDPELILKSRRVVPGRLLAEGFEFTFPRWPDAARDLLDRRRRARRGGSTPARDRSATACRTCG